MDRDDAPDRPTEPVRRDLLDARARRARGDLERNLTPEPPPLSAVRERIQRQHRNAILTMAGIVVVVAVVATALVSRHDPKTEQTAQRPGPEVQLIRSDKARLRGDVGAIPAAVRADTAFAVDLYRRLAITQKGNFFLSPHSISMALAMTLAGADGHTRAQMQKALHVAIPEPAFHSALNALDQALSAPRAVGPDERGADPLKVTTANSLWGQTGYPFRRQFLDRIAESYAAGMNVVDFASRAEASRVAINAWVAAHTDGKITQLIPEGVIDDLTRLVLVNTITFKASWTAKFDTAKPGPFTTPDGTRVTAQMMTEGTGTSASGPGWTSVAIPYVGGAHLVVIMPDDLARFEQTLSPQMLQAAAGGQDTVRITLPKFAITSRLDLKPTLQALGITDAFDAAKADLSRIDGRACPESRCLHVSAVVHQATIDVDEKGTEAAAATAVVIGTVSAPPTIVIDKPFLFAIRDDATGAILFTGRVTNPAA